jgi:hypothetical protein
MKVPERTFPEVLRQVKGLAEGRFTFMHDWILPLKAGNGILHHNPYLLFYPIPIGGIADEEHNCRETPA